MSSHSQSEAAPTPSTTAAEERESSGNRSPVECVWCGARLGASAARLKGRTCCAVCGVATTDPWPDAADLRRAYAHYRPERGRFGGVGDAVLRVTRARLAVRADRLAPPGPILDVGAGDGTLIDALVARGRDATGLERDSQHARVLEADITELDRRWSAVVFWHTLEHLPAPGQAFDHAARQLRPGGVLLVAVPNGSSLQARVFGDRWFHLDLPRHLVHLSADALNQRAASLGLEVTRVSHWRGAQAVFGWLHGFVGTLPGRPDLYDAIRIPEARSRPMSRRRRAVAVSVATLMLLPAALATALEVALRRGGTVYMEARRE